MSRPSARSRGMSASGSTTEIGVGAVTSTGAQTRKVYVVPTILRWPATVPVAVIRTGYTFSAAGRFRTAGLALAVNAAGSAPGTSGLAIGWEATAVG